MYTENYESWRGLKKSYYKAKELFPEYEVGIRTDDACIFRSMVYIKAKEIVFGGILQTDNFAEMISESEEIKIKNTGGLTEIDIFFTAHR